jgi:hypothetical protein
MAIYQLVTRSCLPDGDPISGKTANYLKVGENAILFASRVKI